MFIFKLNFNHNYTIGQYWARVVYSYVFMIAAFLAFGLIAGATEGTSLYSWLPAVWALVAFVYLIMYSWNTILGRVRSIKGNTGLWVAAFIFLNVYGLMHIILGCQREPKEVEFSAAN